MLGGYTCGDATTCTALVFVCLVVLQSVRWVIVAGYGRYCYTWLRYGLLMTRSKKSPASLMPLNWLNAAELVASPSPATATRFVVDTVQQDAEAVSL